MESIWQEFKLIITEPPANSEHFKLIKDNLIPFVDKHSLSFWITNYRDSTRDCILFRVKGNEKQFKKVESFLDELKRINLIVRYDPPTPWSPRKDAEGRIAGLSTRVPRIYPVIPSFDPINFRIDYDFSNNRVIPVADSNLVERQEQLTALFESLGECSKAIYSHLKSKPNDKWIMSLFLHLIMNSMDYSGPDPPREESAIRKIPVF